MLSNKSNACKSAWGYFSVFHPVSLVFLSQQNAIPFSDYRFIINLYICLDKCPHLNICFYSFLWYSWILLWFHKNLRISLLSIPRKTLLRFWLAYFVSIIHLGRNIIFIIYSLPSKMGYFFHLSKTSPIKFYNYFIYGYMCILFLILLKTSVWKCSLKNFMVISNF